MKYRPLEKDTATFYRDEIEKIVKEEKIDRSSLKSFAIAGIYAAESWTEYVKIIKAALPLTINENLFFITSTGWVYQGYADEIFQVLTKLDDWIGDFFIISSKFDWFIAHDYIDECAFMYQG